MKRALAILAVLAGFSVPLQAQTRTPVQVVCTKGGGTYKPICSQVKQAVKRSLVFKPGRSGSRYVLLLYAKTCQTANPGGGSGCNTGDAAMSVGFGAVLNDPVSQNFPYMIASIPWVFSPSESSALAAGIVDGALVAAAIIFEAVVNDINSYGTSGMQFDEAIAEEIQRRMELEIDRVMKEQAH